MPNIIGTAPNQVPTNADLGTMAYQDSNAVKVKDITFSDGSSQQTAASGFGFKNRIINGAMMIDQRNAGASVNVSAGSQVYCLDRWLAYSGGSTTSVQRVASGVTGIPYLAQITGSASNTAVQLSQRIESKNIADLAGSTVTLSVLLSNSLVSTVYWYAAYANSADSFGASTTFASGTFTVTGTLNTYSTQINLPANAANGVEVFMYCLNQTSGTFKIGNVQLEKGSTATSFDYRPYGTELALCQRYCFQMGYANGAQNYTRFPVGMAINTTQTLTVFSLPITMRVVPSLTWNGAFESTSNGNGTGTAAVITADGNTPNEVSVVYTFSSGSITSSAGLCCGFRTSNSTTWYARFESEL